MNRCAQIRKLALALDGVEEKSHFGKPSFRAASPGTALIE